MAPRPKPWFRFYTEALHDRKLRRLTPAQRWLWVAILCIARQSPLPGFLVLSERLCMHDADIADLAGMPVRDVTKAMPMFEALGMLQRDRKLDCWHVANFLERQYESDVSTPRTRKARSKNGDGTAMERPIEDDGTFPLCNTETETDSETELLLTSSSKSLPVGAHDAAGHVDRGLSFGAVQGSEEDHVENEERQVG